MGVKQIYFQLEEELKQKNSKPLAFHIFENNIKETFLQISKIALPEISTMGTPLRQFEQKGGKFFSESRV